MAGKGTSSLFCVWIWPVMATTSSVKFLLDMALGQQALGSWKLLRVSQQLCFQHAGTSLEDVRWQVLQKKT